MRITITILIFLFVLVSNGCTLLGFGVGAFVDSFNHSTEQRPLTEALRSSAGTRMIVRTSQTTFEGKYDFLSLLSKSERDSLFGVVRGLIRGRVVPLAIGDSIIIQRTNLIYPILEGTIAEVRSTQLKLLTRDGITSTPIEQIQELTDPQGLQWSGDRAREHILSGNVLLLKQHKQTLRIPIIQIESIEVEGARYGKLIGAGVGLILDIGAYYSLKDLKFN